MNEMMMSKKKASGTGPQEGLILAMDYEGAAFSDSATPARTFSIRGTGGVAALTGTFSKNGNGSYQQSQVAGGQSRYLTTPRVADLTFAGDFWMEMWGYCLGQGTFSHTAFYNTLISYGAYNVAGGLWRWTLIELKPALRKPNGTGEVTVVQATAAATNNAWHHHAIGRKGSTVYLFLNGAVVATAEYTDTVGFGTIMEIGGYDDNRFAGSTLAGFNGYIDRLRIYNRCLTEVNFIPSTALY